jgi:uncharacterized damage-inducible protein DinB
MQASDVRFIFAFDRWATAKVLDAAVGIEEATWSARNAIDERGLGGILIHHLGASQRWRHGLSFSEESPRPEKEPLPTIAGLRASWEREWAAYDAWLATLDDDDVLSPDEEIPMWQLLLHVVNHGTQHRSEAAVLLTAAGHSPGDLDLVDFAEQRAKEGG